MTHSRVTAADVSAPVDLSPFDNSAVVGYTVRHADLEPDGIPHSSLPTGSPPDVNRM